MAQGPTKAETIETLQGALDQSLEFGKKERRDTRLGRRDEVCFHNVRYAQELVSCHSKNTDPARLIQTPQTVSGDEELRTPRALVAASRAGSLRFNSRCQNLRRATTILRDTDRLGGRRYLHWG